MNWLELQWFAADRDCSPFWLLSEYIKRLEKENLYLKKYIMDLLSKEKKENE